MSRACWIDNFRSPNFLLQHSWVSHKEKTSQMCSKTLLQQVCPALCPRGSWTLSHQQLRQEAQSLEVTSRTWHCLFLDSLSGFPRVCEQHRPQKASHTFGAHQEQRGTSS
jgi:hypothetical protein